jgi:putative addiction module CopG family antidote
MNKSTAISLGERFTEFVEQQVEDGRYASASEVIRAGLRLLEEHEMQVERLRAAIIEGEQSRPSTPIDFDEFLAERRSRRFEAQPMRQIAAPEFAHYPDEWHFSPVVDTGDFVFFAGQTDARADGTVLSVPLTQFREAFASLGKNLAAAGLGFSDIVEMTTYHVDLRRHLHLFMNVKDEHIRKPYPAWTAIGVTELITPGTIIEIRVIARRVK